MGRPPPVVGPTIAFCGLLGWAFGPRNFMKTCRTHSCVPRRHSCRRPVFRLCLASRLVSVGRPRRAAFQAAMPPFQGVFVLSCHRNLMRNATLLTPEARRHLRLLLRSVRPLADRLDRRFRTILRQRPYDALQIRAFLGITPAAASRLRTWDPLESTCRHASLSIL